MRKLVIAAALVIALASSAVAKSERNFHFVALDLDARNPDVEVADKPGNRSIPRVVIDKTVGLLSLPFQVIAKLKHGRLKILELGYSTKTDCKCDAVPAPNNDGD